MDPTSTPVKHTALGRLKHEGATVTIAEDGRVVAYTGDDERFDYLYKFVSHQRYRRGDSRAARVHNKTLLTSGDLYVAKFTGDGYEDGVSDGTGEWLPLLVDNRSRCPASPRRRCWSGPASRRTPSARRRWTVPRTSRPTPSTAAPTSRAPTTPPRARSQIDEANPRTANKHGHIIEITPTAATTPGPPSRGPSS